MKWFDRPADSREAVLKELQDQAEAWAEDDEEGDAETLLAAVELLEGLKRRDTEITDEWLRVHRGYAECHKRVSADVFLTALDEIERLRAESLKGHG